LQTKHNLMQELAKMYRTITKVVPTKTVQTLLTIDGMLGQNSFDQARLFHDISPINGIIITKMDGSAKGGIVFAITSELKIPIAYIAFGESFDAIAPFDGKKYVTELLAKV
jgi:fused signal recognition particle receptor